MSANPKDLFDAVGQLTTDALRPFSGSRKVRVTGSRPDIQVGIREIAQTATPTDDGPAPNPPLVVYDTSGPCTDPDIPVNLLQGLPPLRNPWIEERDDSDVLDGPSSEYDWSREADQALNDVCFAGRRSPRRARSGVNISQMQYARAQGIAEMQSALEHGAQEKADEFRRHGGEIYEKR